jgi:hypothetical protein
MRFLSACFILLFLSLSAAVSTSAQKIWFSDTANSWKTVGASAMGCEWQRIATYGADTIISGLHYRKINYSLTIVTSSSGCTADLGKNFYIREDSNNNLVFYRTLAPSSQEELLYNYNLNLGDTIQYKISAGVTVADSVVGIDTVLINGMARRVFDFQNKEGRGLRAYTVIEGVGCTNNPVFPAFMAACSEYNENLTCFSQNGLAADFFMRQNYCYTLGGNYTINCDATTVGIASNNTYVTPIAKVFPNPASSAINIATENELYNNGSVLVYDLSGRKIFNAPISTSEKVLSINTSSWHNGLYLVLLQDNKGVALKKEIVSVSK